MTGPPLRTYLVRHIQSQAQPTKTARPYRHINSNAGADDKENKALQLSVVPVRCEVSDLDDDLAFSIKVTKRLAVKRLPFSNSPVKRNALVVMKSKGDIRKPRYDPISNQKQQGSTADRHNRLRLDHASHQSVVYGDM